jgi:predicted nucleotidyltransferase
VPRTAKKFDVKTQIARMVKRIVRKFHPEKIILFGSHARGEAGPDSDVDLLVVMSIDGSKLDKMVELRSTSDDIAVPVDILVTTPEDFAWRKDVVGTIEWPASREGKVLYARAYSFNPDEFALALEQVLGGTGTSGCGQNSGESRYAERTACGKGGRAARTLASPATRKGRHAGRAHARQNSGESCYGK